MTIPLAKIKAILLYFSNNTDVKFLGKVKLMKLFYFLDFTHVRKYGSPVTYDRYVNLEHGPIPSAIKNMVDNAADDIHNSELADVISFETPKGTRMMRVIPRREFGENDRKLFSETELEVLDLICKLYGNKTTRDVEIASHREAPWTETKYLHQIPYALAARAKDSMVSEDEINLLMEITS